MAGEFELIAKYFRPLAGPEGLGLIDDAAVITPPAGFDLVITMDLLVEGVHFMPGDAPADIAYKSLAVNISDLAAKGATPAHYFLGLSLPAEKTGDWLAAFAAGLGAAQRGFDITLAGGDTTESRGDVMISITAMGTVPSGAMIKRSGARVGDGVYVSGTLGDAGLGLKIARGELANNDFLLGRYRRPEPRLRLGAALAGLARACADVSDGLMADLGHICAASGVGASIEEVHLPVSAPTAALVQSNPSLRALVYAGGDDYELVFTVAKENHARLMEIADELDLPISRIGLIIGSGNIELIDKHGELVQTSNQGYQHF